MSNAELFLSLQFVSVGRAEFGHELKAQGLVAIGGNGQDAFVDEGLGKIACERFPIYGAGRTELVGEQGWTAVPRGETEDRFLRLRVNRAHFPRDPSFHLDQ